MYQLSINDRVECFKEVLNIKTVGHGALLQGLVLGAHATDAAEIEGGEDLCDLRILAHHFMKGHVFGKGGHWRLS